MEDGLVILFWIKIAVRSIPLRDRGQNYFTPLACRMCQMTPFSIHPLPCLVILQIFHVFNHCMCFCCHMTVATPPSGSPNEMLSVNSKNGRINYFFSSTWSFEENIKWCQNPPKLLTRKGGKKNGGTCHIRHAKG